MQAQPEGRPAIRNGVIFGAILALLGGAITFIQWQSGVYTATSQNITTSQYPNGMTSINFSETGAMSLLSCVIFPAMMALTFVAGYLTARRVGRASAGAISGLITGLFGGLVGGAMEFAMIALLIAPGLQTPALVGGVLVALLDAGLGVGLGALGGLAGVNSYRTMRTGMAAFYPGMPGQPGMPPQPGTYPAPQYPPQYNPPSGFPPPQPPL